MQEVFEKIIEKLEENQTIVFNLGGGKPKQSIDLERAIEIVKQEAENYNNGWIPCSERLPEEGRGVILYVENKAHKGSHAVFMANIHNGKWQMWETSRQTEINYTPIACHQLPELYQPKGK